MIGANMTTIAGDFLRWEPLRRVESFASRWLWLGLYTSGRRAMPGLWQGTELAFADAAKLTIQETVRALDDLLAADLVEYDQGYEVLRLTLFPDRSTRPHNGRHLRSLWTRFQTVADCDVRNSHVRTLQWLLNDPEQPATSDHGTVWDQTFGTITIPSKRRRGVKRLLDHDTSTPIQPSLFPTETAETVTHPHQSDTVSHTHRDQRSEIRDQSSLLPEESKGRANETLPIMVPVPRMDDLPFSVEQMLTVLAHPSKGRFAALPFDGRLTEALCATIRTAHQNQVGLDDLRVVGEWMGAGGLAWRSDLGASWIARPGALMDAVAQARAWVAQGRPDPKSRHASRRADAAPVGAHGSGRRKLV